MGDGFQGQGHKKALAELDTLSEDFRMEVVEHKRGRKVEECPGLMISHTPIGGNHLDNERDEHETKSL